MKTVTLLSLAGTFGLLAWLAFPYIEIDRADQNKDKSAAVRSSTPEETTTADKDTAPLAVREVTSPFAVNSGDDRPGTDSELVNRQSDWQRDESGLGKSGSLDQSSNLILASIGDAAATDDPEDLARLRTQIENLIDNSPDVLSRLLGSYGTMSTSKEKVLLKMVLTEMPDASTRSRLEQVVVDRIVSDIDETNTQWYRLVEDMEITSAKARNQLIEFLPMIVDAKNLSSAIVAVTPSHLTSQERRAVSTDVLAYANHDNNAVRATALEAMGNLIDSDQLHLIEGAIAAGEPRQIRDAALRAAHFTEHRSESLQTTLLSVMQDGSERTDTRVRAHRALEKYDLVGNDYRQFAEFRKRVEQGQGL